MLSLRNRFGIPGVISVIALVFALVGGTAFAADNSGSSASASAKKKNRAKKNRKGNAGLNGKQKRQVIALAKRFAGAGPMGPQGVPGLPGAPGAKGADGDDGSDGSDGSGGQDGDSVVSTDLLVGDVECPEGGSKFEVGGDTTFACNGANGPQGPEGPEGSPWTGGGFLPPGETMTGYWAVPDPEDTVTKQRITLSFPLRLSTTIAAPSAHGPGDADFSENCTGNGTSTFTAQPGELCVYGPLLGYTTEIQTFERTGGLFTVKVTNPTQARAFARGAWAVTGCGNEEFPCPE